MAARVRQAPKQQQYDKMIKLILCYSNTTRHSKEFDISACNIISRYSLPYSQIQIKSDWSNESSQ